MPYPSEEDFYASGDPDVGDARPLSDIDGNGRALPSLLGEMGDQLDEITVEMDDTITQIADVAAQAAVATHTSDTTAAHAATAISFTPSGTVAATTVQAAIVEVNTEKASTTHGHTLDDLSDVAAGAPVDGQVLKYSSSSTRWEPSTDLTGGGGGGANQMGDLTDVDLTGLATNDGLVYNGTDFVPEQLALQADLDTDEAALAAHIADTSAAHAASAIAFTPAGTVAATTVQAAIEEVASEGGGGGGVTLEEVQDNLGTSFLQPGNNIDITYSDPFNLVSIAVQPLTHTDITDWDAEVREVVPGEGITISSTATETTISSLQPIITDFTTTGTWTKGADTKLVEVICVGAGGGGGSGRRGATSTVRGGGGGGASGNWARMTFSAAECGTNEAVTVSTAGGAGGPAVTTNDTNGNAGSSGSASSFGALISASGGGGGGGGTTVGGTAGPVGARGTNSGLVGAAGGATAAATVIAGLALSVLGQIGHGSGGGGGGAGIDGSNAVQGSSNGGNGPLFRTTTQTGGTGGGTGVAGGAGSAAGTYGGSGGGGGGAGTAGASGAGGAGARASGGGGGGAALNANTASAGGAGGGGFVRVIEYR